jgi:uncharacterized repeat protein (TIGR03943 family)
MTRWRFFILGAWALGVAVLRLGHHYTLFIRPELWPLLLGSFIILTLFLAAMFIRHTSARRVALADWIRGGMLLLPLLYLGSLITSANASGPNVYQLQTKTLGWSNTTDSSSDSDAAAFDPAHPAINLGYVARHMDSLQGQRVVTEGCVWHDDTRPANQIVIFRFVIVCCAADAIPVQAVVESPATKSLQNDHWVQVAGTLHIQTDANGDKIPVITADQLTPIPTPDEPFLSQYQF